MRPIPFRNSEVPMNSRLFAAAGLVTAAVVLPVLGFQESQTSAPPVAPTAAVSDTDAILAALDKRVRLEEVPANVPLRYVFDTLSKQFDITCVVNEETYKSQGLEGILERKPSVNQKLNSLRLSQFLKLVLEGCLSGYVVRRDYIEIVPIPTQRGLFVPQELQTEDGPFVRTNLPIVNMKFHQAELEDAIRQLAD